MSEEAIVRTRKVSISEDPRDCDDYYYPSKPKLLSPLIRSESKSLLHQRDEQVKPKASLPRNESSMFSVLTRSTSLMTWATSDTIHEEEDGYDYDDGGYTFPSLVKKLSMSGKRYIPMYGSMTGVEESQLPVTDDGSHNHTTTKLKKDSDENMSGCSYESGAQNLDSHSSHSCLSYDEEIPEKESQSPSHQEEGAYKEVVLNRGDYYIMKRTSESGLKPNIQEQPLKEVILNKDDYFIIKREKRPVESVDSDNSEETSVLDESDTSYAEESPISAQKIYLAENIILRTCVEVRDKSKGLKSEAPVSKFSGVECAWTFAGSFSIIALLTFCSSQIAIWAETGRSYAFPLGPFGALTTLQYSLTDAAPAQPRNVLMGSTICGVVAMLTTMVPETILPIWIRIALATSASISLMARAGIQHPPGGAIALVFSMGNHTWLHLMMTLGGCSVAVGLATLVNNLNMNRQYPQYWDFGAPFRRKHRVLPTYTVSV